MKRIPSRTTEKKWQHRFSHHNPICYHGNQWSDLAEFQSHPSSRVCYHYLQSMKRIRSRTAEQKWRHRFSHYGDFFQTFFRRSRAAYSAVGGPIRPKFELVRALMHVIVTCKFEKERVKNSREKVETPFFPS